MIGRRVPPAYTPIAPLAGLARGGDARAGLRARLRARFDAADARLAGSGTQALRLAVRAALEAGGHARAGPPIPNTGPLVAIPAYTCYDVAAAVLAETGRLACFDVDPLTLAPDPGSVGRVLAAGASVVVVSPLFGVPVPWEPLEEAARRAGAVVIEDAAQGHGASWHGRPLGALGPLSVISFARGKGWTGGVGGAVLARGAAADGLRALDELDADPRPVRAARVLLAAAAQWVFGRPALYAVPASLPWLRLGETVYRPAPPAEAMPAVAARLALAAEAAADEEAEARRRRAAWLRSRVPSGMLVRTPRGGVPGWLRLPIRLTGGGGPLPHAVLRAGLAPSYPLALPDLPEVRPALDGAGGPWPGAERLARELVTLPTHSLLRRNDAERLLRWLDSRHGEGPPRAAQRRYGTDVARGTSVAHEDSRE